MFANGDGLCFFTPDRKLHGFRVNRVENNRLFPLSMPEELKAGMALYRNNDMVFERAMQSKTAERKLALDMTISVDCGKIILEAVDETGRKAFTSLDEPLQDEATNRQHHTPARETGQHNVPPWQYKIDGWCGRILHPVKQACYDAT